MTGKTSHVTQLDDLYYRMKFVAEADDLLGPARAPEGRFHAPGQKALYLSSTPGGCLIASQAYFRNGDGPRATYPIHVASDAILDLRDSAATAFFEVDVSQRPINWRAYRANGERPPTWDISDRVRHLGLHGMLYRSRTQPELTHLTLFAWNVPGAATLTTTGKPVSHL